MASAFGNIIVQVKPLKSKHITNVKKPHIDLHVPNTTNRLLAESYAQNLLGIFTVEFLLKVIFTVKFILKVTQIQACAECRSKILSFVLLSADPGSASMSGTSACCGRR